MEKTFYYFYPYDFDWIATLSSDEWERKINSMKLFNANNSFRRTNLKGSLNPSEVLTQ